jgi:hypothetical protein
MSEAVKSVCPVAGCRLVQAADAMMKTAASDTTYGCDTSDRRHDHNQRIMRCGKCGKPNFTASVVAPL